MSRRGLALVLTLFVVAILVTLSTSFAIIVVNESKGSRGDKNSKLAYQIATSAIDSIAAYMGAPVNWNVIHWGSAGIPVGVTNPDPVSGTVDPVSRGSESFMLFPAPTPISLADGSKVQPWTSMPFMSPVPGASPENLAFTLGPGTTPITKGTLDPNFFYTVTFGAEGTTPDPAQPLPTFQIDSTFIASAQVVLQRLGFPNDGSGVLLGSNDDAYLAQATVQVFQTGSTTPLSSRVVLARIRMGATSDAALLLQNTGASPGTLVNNPSLFSGLANSVGGDPDKAAALSLLTQNVSNEQGAGGIPFGDQLQGNVTVINMPASAPSALQPGSGTVSLFGSAQDFSNGGATKFNRNLALGQGSVSFPDLGIPSTPVGNVSKALNGAGVNANANSLFSGGTSSINATQIPGSGANPTASNFHLLGGGQAQIVTSAEDSFTQTNNFPPGSGNPTHFIADSSNGVATAVPGSSAHTDPSTGHSDLEMAVDASGNPIPGAPPGIPTYQVSVTQVAGQGDQVTVNEVGAYSGKVLNTVTYPAGQVPPVLYFDGGNVQFSGNLQSNMTIISGASTQRPTVDAFDPTNPQLVTYPTINGTQTGGVMQADLSSLRVADSGMLSKSNYASPDSSIFFPNGTSQPAVVPAVVKDTSTGQTQTLWPAWDP
ncbi:MAG: hypothetical protein ACYCW6_17610, partial [Candidatus Xenobia bacterium]